MDELGQDLSLFGFGCEIRAAPPAQPEELWMFVVKLEQDLSLIVFACEIRAAPPA